MPGLSEKLLVSHHDNNYVGAVKRLGAIRGDLDRLDLVTAPDMTLAIVNAPSHGVRLGVALHFLGALSGHRPALAQAEMTVFRAVGLQPCRDEKPPLQ